MKKLDKPIYCTKPDLPNRSELFKLFLDIFNSNILTNFGPIHNCLENELKIFFKNDNIVLCNNATIGLIISLLTLNKHSGEIITSPYTFPATFQVIKLLGFTPVFCDIEEKRCSINYKKIEEKINKNTVAILPVHPYGIPCDVKEIDDIGEKNNIIVIYDAAPSFNVYYKGKSILEYGDFSVLSFHATKVFNTIEGGLISCKNSNDLIKINSYRNFGYGTNPFDIGINAKLSEFHSAVGLLLLKNINNNIEKRKIIYEFYQKELQTNGISFIEFSDDVIYNYNNIPIFIEDNFKLKRDELIDKLNEYNIFPKKYYEVYPNTDCKIAIEKSNKVLCLPIYSSLDLETVNYICKVIKGI